MYHPAQKEVQVGESKLLKKTPSVCPRCVKVIPAKIVEENNQIFIEKTCQEHGDFKEMYWSDAKLYRKFDGWSTMGPNPQNPNVEIEKGCPLDCGLCKVHESQTLLGIIDVTNKCNLRCHYCFANAATTGYVYEPTFDEICEMMDTLKAEKPGPVLGLLLSGGEPLIRKDIVDIVKKAREKGFTQVLIATNGIEIAKNLQLAKDLQATNLTCLYLKFNGVSPNTGWENHKYMDKIFENCKKSGLQLTLVPTIMKNFNDHEVYDIIKVALDNLDIVRAVNFQPISFCGRMSQEQLKNQRITIPCLIKEVEKRSEGVIKEDSFFPIPTVVPFSKTAEMLLNIKHATFSSHSHCGAATYLFKDGDKIIPVTDFVDVYKLMEELNELAKKEKPEGLLQKAQRVNEVRKILKRNIDSSKAPEYVKLNRILTEMMTGNYIILQKFHLNTLFVGTMHFMDLYNYDIGRVKKCVIHYVTPDQKIIPFCAYNILHYREQAERGHAKEFGPLENHPVKE